MRMRNAVTSVLVVVLAPSVAHAVFIGWFPGLDKLIERADAIVILRVDRHLTDFGSPTFYSTQECYIFQTLKGDIPVNERIPLRLMDTRLSMVPPYGRYSTHLMFLTRKQRDNEPTEYRTLPVRGANVRLSPFGQEKMPEGDTLNEQIRALLKSTAEYNQREHEKEQAFLNRMIEGAAEPPDPFERSQRIQDEDAPGSDDAAGEDSADETPLCLHRESRRRSAAPVG